MLKGSGKVMGLAPCGEKSNCYNKLKEFVKMVPEEDKPYTISLDGKKVNYETITDKVVGPKVDWNPRGKINKDVNNIAWAIQKETEEAVLATVIWAKDYSGEDKVALAGGGLL